MPKEICFAFVCFRPGAELERALASVPSSTRFSYEIVVVDNTPADLLVYEREPEDQTYSKSNRHSNSNGRSNSSGHISSNGHSNAGKALSVGERIALNAGARYVSRPDNPGYGRGMNLGFYAASSAKFFVVCNPDIVLHPGCIDRIVEDWEDHGGRCILGPSLLDLDGKPYPNGRAFPSLLIGAGHALLGWFWPGNPATRAYHGPYRSGTDRSVVVDWVSGALIFTDAQTWRELDGFDESYFMFFEDVDLCLRAKSKGIETRLVGQAKVSHEQGVTWKKQPLEMMKAHHVSALHFLSRIYAGRRFAPVRLLFRLGLGLRLSLLGWFSRRNV